MIERYLASMCYFYRILVVTFVFNVKKKKTNFITNDTVGYKLQLLFSWTFMDKVRTKQIELNTGKERIKLENQRNDIHEYKQRINNSLYHIVGGMEINVM